MTYKINVRINAVVDRNWITVY